MKFDLNYSPDSYFENISFEQKAGSRIKGYERRKIAVKGKKSKVYPPELVGRNLNPYIRESEGQTHPKLMGGEYLPDMDSNESEICRIVLKSTTVDVIQMKANIENGLLNYCVTDEYADDPEMLKYVLKHKTSQRPLPMSLLIENIDTCMIIDGDELYGTGLVYHFIERYDTFLDPGIEELVTVESVFYPELKDYYENQKKIWIDKLIKERSK